MYYAINLCEKFKRTKSTKKEFQLWNTFKNRTQLGN